MVGAPVGSLKGALAGTLHELNLFRPREISRPDAPAGRRFVAAVSPIAEGVARPVGDVRRVAARPVGARPVGEAAARDDPVAAGSMRSKVFPPARPAAPGTPRGREQNASPVPENAARASTDHHPG